MPRQLKSRAGRSFEEAVTAVQKLFDQHATVTHDERLVDRLGHSRQYDVVMRGKLAGCDVLGVIECKDTRRKVGTPEVNAFADVTANLRANVRLIASRAGFTRPALELAKFHGIGAISLMKADSRSAGIVVASSLFAAIYTWTKCRVEFPGADLAGVDMTRADSITWRDQPLLEIAARELFTRYVDLQDEGIFHVQVRFREPADFRQGSHAFSASVMTIDAVREAEKFTRRVAWFGPGVCDWHDSRLRWPEGSEFTSAWVRTDFTDWEPYAGDLPPMVEGSPFEVRILGFRHAKPFPSRDTFIGDHAEIEIVKHDATKLWCQAVGGLASGPA